MEIKVGYLLSYDYHMFLTSVNQLYEHVDKIVVGIDEDYLTWSGNSFTVPQSFFDEVEKFDKRNIIEFYFDKFYIPSLSPMECESRERNMVLQKLGKGWKIQLDVDEYVVDIPNIIEYLSRYNFLNFFPKLTPVSFRAKMITLIKKNEDGFFYVKDNHLLPLITNQNRNTFTRRNEHSFNSYAGFRVIHQSWARSETEIEQKIGNWGHINDFDTVQYFEFWKGINENNYREIRDFHPLNKKEWECLHFTSAKNIDDFINKFSSQNESLFFKINKPMFVKFLIYNIFFNLKSLLKKIINYERNEFLKSKYRTFRKIND